jgi:HPt (histidine-containing phosphotransfer) domain-containing protein
MWFRKNTLEEKLEENENKYSIEIGHSKSGSAHILVIKSLKVRGDNVEDMMAELKEALKQFEAVSEVA